MRLFLVLLVPLCSLAYGGPCDEPCGDPVQPSDISFALPFYTGDDDFCPKCPKRRLALDVPLEASRDVALISTKGVCHAKTAHTFDYKDLNSYEFDATLLEGAETCFSYLELALMGVDPARVRIIPPSDDQSPLPKDVESEARQLAQSCSEAADKGYPISDSSPKIVRAGEVTLVKFGRVTNPMADQQTCFTTVMLAKSKMVLLEGLCAKEYIFFSVNDKLHVTYSEHCVNCGWEDILVCDISSGTPKKVYRKQVVFSD